MVIVACVGRSAADPRPAGTAAQPATRAATAPAPRFKVGTIRPAAIRECSGIVASRTHAGVLWAVNDSGNPAALFAVTREGELIRQYAVAAENVDWEDLAIDDAGHLYIADVGNNGGTRKEVRVYRVDEPDPRAAPGADDATPPALAVSAAWRVGYPAAPFDSEAMFVRGGHGYLIPKRVNASPAELYAFDLAPPAAGQEPATLRRVTDLPMVRAPVTAADVSADGKRLAVLTVLGPYVIELDGGDLARAGASPARYARYVHPVMEAACFVPDGLLVATESRDVLLFRDALFGDVRRKP